MNVHIEAYLKFGKSFFKLPKFKTIFKKKRRH